MDNLFLLRAPSIARVLPKGMWGNLFHGQGTWDYFCFLLKVEYVPDLEDVFLAAQASCNEIKSTSYGKYQRRSTQCFSFYIFFLRLFLLPFFFIK